MPVLLAALTAAPPGLVTVTPGSSVMLALLLMLVVKLPEQSMLPNESVVHVPASAGSDKPKDNGARQEAARS
jgi:hypothetical protein